MEIVDCYRMLGLRSGATFADVKASYRRLAQQYHPDINPDDQKAKDKFIALTEAYKLLLQTVSSAAPSPHINNISVNTDIKPPHQAYSPPEPPKSRPQPGKKKKTQTANFRPGKGGTQSRVSSTTAPRSATAERVKTVPVKPPNAKEVERQLKWKTYQQLQQFLRDRRFPQAIALAEALAERLPDDVEVRQWQAISYQIWGRALIAEKQWLKARIYLKKALRTDPNNKSLVEQVQRDFKKLEHVF